MTTVGIIVLTIADLIGFRVFGSNAWGSDMRICCAMLAMLVTVGPTLTAHADSIPRSAETVWLNADGSARLQIAVELSPGARGSIRLPLAVWPLAALEVSVGYLVGFRSLTRAPEPVR